MKLEFEDKTTDGFWVRNVEEVPVSEENPFVLHGEVGNHSSQPPSDNPLDWLRESWTRNGRHTFCGLESGFDLVKVQNEA
jgi:hypothetical protein